MLSYATWAPSLLESELGPSTSRQIAQAFHQVSSQSYPFVILGNSRMYRDLNPDAMQLNAYNFAHDEDSYNHEFFKLKFLEREGRLPPCLILGVDYFMFSELPASRALRYSSFLGPEFLKDYPSSLDGRFNELMSGTFANTFPDFVRITAHKLSRRSIKPAFSLRQNGQYVLHSAPVDNHLLIRGFSQSRRSRDARRLRVQESYFEKLLSCAKEHSLRVFLVMPPSTSFERHTYDQRAVAENEAYLLRQVRPGVDYLNYFRDTRFPLTDFADTTHLNPEAADRFSKIVGAEILTRLGRDQVEVR